MTPPPELAAALGAIPAAACLVDADEAIVAVNHEAERLFGPLPDARRKRPY